MPPTGGCRHRDGTQSRSDAAGESLCGAESKDGANVHQITDTPGQDEEYGEWGVHALWAPVELSTTGGGTVISCSSAVLG